MNDSIDKKEEFRCIKLVKECLYAKFQECKECLSTSPILQTYVTFKADFRLEKYFLCMKDFKLRKCIAK